VNNRNKAMILILGLLVVAALAGVIYGVVTHEEPGLMEEWPTFEARDFPLPYSVGRYTSEGMRIDPEGESLVASTVATINARLGFLAFRHVRYVPEGRRSRINIDLGVPWEKGWMDSHGSAEMQSNEGTLTCDIRTSNTGTDDLLGLVLHHELGHCLGLAHDDYEQSIMRPVQSRTSSGVLQPWISDYDRALLRRMYHD